MIFSKTDLRLFRAIPFLLIAIFFLVGAPVALAQNLYIGFGASGVSTNITSGTNSYNVTYVGVNTGDSNNSLGVFYAGTLLSNSSTVAIGYQGSSNSMVISNGATVAGGGSYIGYSGSANNYVLVTGSNSLFTITGNLAVGTGVASSGNRLVISNGALVVAKGHSDLSLSLGATNNSVLVTGPGSQWRGGTYIAIGVQDSYNSLVVSNGANVYDTIGYIGYSSTSFSNTVLITSNSLWSNGGNLYVGYIGSSNSLTIQGSSTVTVASNSYIGASNNSAGNSVVVDHSTWSNGIRVYLGGTLANSNSVGNSLTITNQGVVYGAVSLASSSNSLIVTGSNSILYGTLLVGGGVSNTATIESGGKVIGVTGQIGWNPGGLNNIVTVTSFGSLWSNSGNLYVGPRSTNASLVVSNGGTVITGGFAMIGGLIQGASNSVVVTGLGSSMSNGGILYVGNSNDSYNSLTLSGGGTITDATDAFIGYASNSFGNTITITGTNSQLNNGGNLYVGYFGSSNRLVISNGGKVYNALGYLGNDTNSSNNSVVVTGAGSLLSNALDL
jgi:T5SS/PEP-CTERM-associated repeat protein